MQEKMEKKKLKVMAARAGVGSYKHIVHLGGRPADW